MPTTPDPFATNDSDKFPTNPRTRKVCSMLIEVILSNPNGEPNDGGNPREDNDGYGIITGPCLKRKFRDYLEARGHGVYVKHGAQLQEVQRAFNNDSAAMVKEFWDLRIFGGPMTTAKPKLCAGLVQFETARSVEPIDTKLITVTRVAYGSGSSAEKKGKVEDASDEDNLLANDEGASEEGKEKKEKPRKDGGNMGNSTVVTHAIYRANFTFNPNSYHAKTVTEDDMSLFWAACVDGWEESRSSSRPAIHVRRVVVFDYDTERGNVHSHLLNNRLTITPPQTVRPLRWDDYEIELDLDNLPKGITVYEWADCKMIRPERERQVSASTAPVATAK